MAEVSSTARGGEPAARPHQGDQKPGAQFDFYAMRAEMDALLEKQLFFLGGAAKSGTTWLQALLDAHPSVSCTGENQFVNFLFPSLRKVLEEHNRLLLDPRKNTAYAIGRQPALFDVDEFLYLSMSAALSILLKQTRAKPGVRAVGDKTTKNVQAFAQLLTWFPRSKGLHIVRDPRDGAVSGWHHVSRLFPQESRATFPAMDDYVRHYADVWVVEIGSAVQAAKREPARLLELRYEDLIGNPEPLLARVFRFLGVEDEPVLVARCVEAASFQRLSGGRAPGQESTGSFFRKGVVGDWQNRLSPETVAYVLAKCGELMKHFGYL